MGEAELNELALGRRIENKGKRRNFSPRENRWSWIKWTYVRATHWKWKAKGGIIYLVKMGEAELNEYALRRRIENERQKAEFLTS